MGTVLLIGGLAGAAIGVIVFNYLKSLGQVDLLVKLCYVVFLGIIGGMMFVESLNAIRNTKSGKAPKRKKHNWVHGLPLKVRFSHIGPLYQRDSTTAGRGLCGRSGGNHGRRGWIYHGASDDLFAGHANQGGSGDIAVPDHFCHRLYYHAARHDQLYGGRSLGGSVAGGGRDRCSDRHAHRR